MGKPTRSPLLGYNHNVKYRGRIFHIQTEDSGPVNPHIFTHLFFEGTILASKRHIYDPSSPEDMVRGLMQGQHKALLKELKQAIHDERIARFFAARGEVLDEAATAAPEVAAEHRALDLDAAPISTTPPPETAPPPILAPPAQYDAPVEQIAAEAVPVEEMPMGAEAVPEPVPEPIPEAYPEAQPDAPLEGTDLPDVPLPEVPARPVGPGIYTSRGTRERPFEGPAYPQHPTQRPTPPPSRTPTPPVVVIPPAPRRRPLRPVNPITPVVVQRTIAVGETKPNTVPPGQPFARPRRPAQAIPYVVREGSHPLAHRSMDSPPARPLAPPPAAAAARTAARRPDARPPVEVVADKSLDEVILAYLAHEGGSSDSGENR